MEDRSALRIEPGARTRNWDEFMRRSRAGRRSARREQCERVLLPAGVPCSRYKNGEEMMQDPYFVARGLFARVEDAAGAYLVPNTAFQMSGSRAEVRGTVPKLGEHADEVLGGLLQYPRHRSRRCAPRALSSDAAIRPSD